MTTLGRVMLYVVLATSHVWTVNGQDGPTVNGGGKGTTLPSTDVCGKRGDRFKRVVGGSDANPGMYPWIAALGYRRSENTSTSWLCGGSLVTDRHIVTAAQCVAGGGSNITVRVVRLGVVDLTDTAADNSDKPTDYEVESFILHPDFKVFEKVNDIAIITLKKKVTFSRVIRPICLPTSDEFKTKNFTGSAVFIAGYGSSHYRNRTSTRLQHAELRLWGQQECNASYSGIKQAVIDNRVVCANGDGKDSCQGDSGTPLMMPYGAGSNYYLYGIVSYGYKCAVPNYPGVYTRVSEFAGWVVENLK